MTLVDFGHLETSLIQWLVAQKDCGEGVHLSEKSRARTRMHGRISRHRPHCSQSP